MGVFLLRVPCLDGLKETPNEYHPCWGFPYFETLFGDKPMLSILVLKAVAVLLCSSIYYFLPHLDARVTTGSFKVVVG